MIALSLFGAPEVLACVGKCELWCQRILGVKIGRWFYCYLCDFNYVLLMANAELRSCGLKVVNLAALFAILSM